MSVVLGRETNVIVPSIDTRCMTATGNVTGNVTAKRDFTVRGFLPPSGSYPRMAIYRLIYGGERVSTAAAL